MVKRIINIRGEHLELPFEQTSTKIDKTETGHLGSYPRVVFAKYLKIAFSYSSRKTNDENQTDS
jgi:hypothetical protein